MHDRTRGSRSRAGWITNGPGGATSRTLRLYANVLLLLLGMPALWTLAGCQGKSEIETESISQPKDSNSPEPPDLTIRIRKIRQLAEEAKEAAKQADRRAEAVLEAAAIASQAETDAREGMQFGDYSDTASAADRAGPAAERAAAAASEASTSAAESTRIAEEVAALVQPLASQSGETSEDVEAALQAENDAREAAARADSAREQASRYARIAGKANKETQRIAAMAAAASEATQAAQKAREAAENAAAVERQTKTALASTKKAHGQALSAVSDGQKSPATTAAAAASAAAERASELATEAGRLAKDSSQRARAASAALKPFGDGAPDGFLKGSRDAVLLAQDAAGAAAVAQGNASRFAAEAARLAEEASRAASEPTTNLAQQPLAKAEDVRAVEGKTPDDPENPLTREGKELPATAPSASTGKAPPRIDLGSVPTVRRLPVRRERPTGIILATTQPVASLHAASGTWRQIAGGNSPDFLPGGYKANALTFGADGTIHVTRTFGEKGAISRKWRIGFQLDTKTGSLNIGKDPKKRPPADSLLGKDMQALDPSVKPAVKQLPLTLKWKRLSDDMIQLGDKVYKKPPGKN